MLAAGPILELAFVATMALAVLGTAIGSVVRDIVVQAFARRTARSDLGLLAVNFGSCAIAGLAAGGGTLLHSAITLGFAGGLSTWSSLAVEVAGDLRARRWTRIALHIPGACALGLVAYLLARSVAGVAA